MFQGHKRVYHFCKENGRKKITAGILLLMPAAKFFLKNSREYVIIGAGEPDRAFPKTYSLIMRQHENDI